MSGFRTLVLVVLSCFLLSAQDFKDFEKRVTEFTLPNGLHFLVAERHEAPVVSFHTYVKVGSVDDPSGKTGLAHMFEHMAFKGTESIGSKDWPAERKALDEIEAAYDRLEAEKNKGPKADELKIAQEEVALRKAIEQAQSYVSPNEYSGIIEEKGGAGLNASTSQDATEYFYSLPSNRLELWFLMESQRFLHPVFREFYKERDVVMEEHRMRVESNPQGKLFQFFLTEAFAAHPYRQPTGGWPSDIANLRRSFAKSFFDTYYVPGNITMAIVGDVNPAEAKRLAERYFGPMQARPLPPVVRTVEPPQPGPRVTEVDSAAQPVEIIGYHRPDQYDRDDPVFDVLHLILSSGRTGWLYKELVEQRQVALVAQAGADFPGSRYPNLFVFFVAPSQGHTLEENNAAIDAVIKRLQTQRVDTVTMTRAKTQARAGVIRQLADNAGLAGLLAMSFANYGDWRKLFTTLDDLDKVTPEDVLRVSQKYFTPANRTTAFLTQGGIRPAAGGRQ